MTTAVAFWKNCSFTELVLQKISSTCIDTKLSLPIDFAEAMAMARVAGAVVVLSSAL